LGIQTKLQAVASSLDALVQQPAHPPHQQNLASALTAFEHAVTKMTEQISPAAYALVRELDGERFFDPAMSAKVKQAIVGNAMTPSVARDYVRGLYTDRDAYLAVLNSINQGIRKLGIKGEDLPVGSAEMAFMIPRGIFSNDLGAFAKELGFINRLVRHVSEAINEQVQPVELGQISSSDPTITLAAAIGAMTLIGEAVNKFLDAWKKIEEIRDIRQKLAKLGIRDKTNLKALNEEITSTVNEVVEESTTLIMSQSQVEQGRRNELDGLIRKDLLQLFGQVERGLVVEVRVSPPTASSGESDPNFDRLKVLSQTMQFPPMTHEPVLVPSGDLLDDNGSATVISHRKKTSTKTSTTKKTSSKTKDPLEGE
jgi:hypothetical protein